MAGMERSSSSSSSTKDLKHKSCFMAATHMKKLSNNNVKESYYYGNEDDEGLMCWPPRSYTCSFCKREFKSAQALGGHMNVHRRDRAKFLMRHHSSPPLADYNRRYSLLNLNNLSNPNPNISPSRKFCHWGKGDVVPNNDHLKSSTSAKALFGFEKLGSFCMQQEEFLRLDLEVGLFTESKQDLDLELRLGYT
ncbi:hypothetical protein HAX54_039125 [Datura stramonium]|uniref:C2H2-type domain-containing protein n=1 Tax=Datura stramonium TaxID=4076 RepID=A0ABS8VM57_DATST|nr:hypothetical protein [Datura stramonium]